LRPRAPWPHRTGMPDVVGDPLQIIRVGRVASVNLAQATCTVEIGDPDAGGFATDDIQWLAQRAGETSTWSPPSIGEQGLLICPDGDIAQAVFVPGLFSTSFPAPGASEREFTRYADEAEFGYDPESHHADITLPAGATLTIRATGGASIDVNAGGLDIDGDQRNTGMIDALKEITSQIDVWFRRVLSLRRHTHSAASQPWTGDVPPPPVDPEP